ncbi:MAG: hypothetical protein NT062_13510 [Proteobacteria bacterium]|nr:hypothetical protein [Pseudomonadota bacterium]
MAGGRRRRHVEVDVALTAAAVEDVGAGVAVERVVARATPQGVDARAALELVVAWVAGDVVVAAARDHVLDVEPDAIGLADLAARGRAVHHDGQIGGSGVVVDRVDPGTADHRVVARRTAALIEAVVSGIP